MTKWVPLCAAVVAAAAILSGCGDAATTTSSSDAGTAGQPTTASSPETARPVAPPPVHHRRHRHRSAAASATTSSSATAASTTSSTASAPAGPTPAIQKAVNELLTVDTGAPPTSADTQTVTADFLRLAGKCRESPEKLASEIWANDQDLHKNGVQEDAVSVSNHLVTVATGLSASATPTDCASLLAAYLVLREQ
jgi:hypothetical protein